MVSIIIPVYNCECFITDTLKSVLNQTYQDYEIVVVDDCSTDRTVDIIKNLLIDKENVKIIELAENSGAAVARNKGIEMAKGEFIAFLDSDDIWESRKLEKQIAFMINNNYYFSFTYYTKIDEQGKLMNKVVKSPNKLNYSKLLKVNYIGCSTVIYNQSKIGKVYMPLIRKRQDYGLWLAILKKIDYGFCLEEILTKYRVRKNSISSNKIKLIKYNWYLLRRVENINALKSLYYISCNIFIKIFIKK